MRNEESLFVFSSLFSTIPYSLMRFFASLRMTALRLPRCARKDKRKSLPRYAHEDTYPHRHCEGAKRLRQSPTWYYTPFPRLPRCARNDKRKRLPRHSKQSEESLSRSQTCHSECSECGMKNLFSLSCLLLFFA